MNKDEIKEILDELNTVRPEKLNKETKRLFDAIMKISDDKDKAESNLYEANNRISDLLDIVKQKDKIIDDMAEFILRDCNDLKLFCENKSETLCQTMYEHYNCIKCIKDYFEKKV